VHFFLCVRTTQMTDKKQNDSLWTKFENDPPGGGKHGKQTRKGKEEGTHKNSNKGQEEGALGNPNRIE